MSEDRLILDASPPPSVAQQRNTDSPKHEYPESFVRAVRETPVPPPELTQINSKEFVVAGQGMGGVHRKKTISLTDLYAGDIDFLPFDGQAALKEIEKNKIRRARERTMQELQIILQRVRLTLEEFGLGDKEEHDEELRKEERKRKRHEQRQKKREKAKKAHQKRKEELRIERMKKQRLKEEKEEKSKETTTEKETEMGGSDRHSSLTLVDVVEGVIKTGVRETPTIGGKETAEMESSGAESDEGDEENNITEEGEESSSDLEFDSEDEEDDEDETEGEDEPGEEVIIDGVIVKPKKVSGAAIKKAARRREVLSTIASYLELCIQREDLMRQMKQWIETSVSEEFSAIKPVLCFSPELLGDHKPTSIATDMERFHGSMGKLKDIADSLGIGEEKELEDIDENFALMSGARPPTQGRTKQTTSTFNEEELAHPESWKIASSFISKALDDASKTTPARRVRQSLTAAAKQFKFMSLAMDKRVEKIRQLDQEILDSGGEMTKLKKNNEILRDTKKKLQVKYEKMEYKNNDLLQKLRDTEDQVKELTSIVEDYKKKESLGLYDQSSSEESIASTASNKTVSLVSLAPSGNMLAPTGEKQQITTRVEGTQTPQLVAELDPAIKQDMSKLMKEYEKAKNQLQTEKEKLSELEVTLNVLSAEKVKFEQEKTELEIKLDDLSRQTEREAEQKQKQIEELEMANVKMKNELECQEEMIKYQEDRITQYSEELQILEERLQSFPPTPAAQSRASIAQFAHAFRQERRRSSLAVEPATAKQMLAKVKQQHEQEIQSLKDHLGRENQRNQADLRRLEQEHKKDTQNIHKESLQVLRAINRFKDSIATILDRENLLTEAHEMRKLNPLPLEETLVDTRQMLARMAILSNELLVSMELCLSKAMMSKRLEIKDTTAIKGLVQRDLDRHMEALKKAKEFGLLQMEKFKGAREDLHEQELEHMRARQMDEMKQFDLVDQFKEVVNQYGDLKKQSASSRKQHQEEIKRKNDQVKRVMRRSEELNKTIDQQKTIINQLTSQWRSRRIGQVYISREDQQMNLKILQEALTENQISEQLCLMTTGMIKESLEYPRKRFIALVKKYFHYKRAKEIREKVKKLKLEGSLSQRITEYLKVLGQRSEMQREAWLRKKQEFVQMRANIIEQLNIVITRVNEETGILLTRPLDLSTRTEEGHEGPPDRIPPIPKGRSRYRRMAESEHHRAPPSARAPSPLAGTNVMVEYEQRMLWKIPHGHSSTMVTTPRILEMEVNRSRMAAQSMMTAIAMGQWDRLDSRYRHKQVIGKSRSEPAYKQAYNAGLKRNLSLPPIATLYPEEKKPHKQQPN